MCELELTTRLNASLLTADSINALMERRYYPRKVPVEFYQGSDQIQSSAPADSNASSQDGEPSSTSALREAAVLEELEIREMTLADIHVIYEMGEEVFTSDKWPQLHRTWDEYEVLDAIMNDRETSLVATMNGKVVGFALGVLIEKKNSPWIYGYLKWLAVDPTVGRHGVASALFKELRSLFIQNGARMLLVDTHAENEGALRFFKKNGFGSQEEHVYLSLNLTHEKDYLRHKARNKKS